MKDQISKENSKFWDELCGSQLAKTLGEGAPHTDWISKKSLSVLCKNFSTFKPVLENIDSSSPFKWYSREQLLKTKIPSWVGLDLYATAKK